MCSSLQGLFEFQPFLPYSLSPRVSSSTPYSRIFVYLHPQPSSCLAQFTFPTSFEPDISPLSPMYTHSPITRIYFVSHQTTWRSSDTSSSTLKTWIYTHSVLLQIFPVPSLASCFFRKSLDFDYHLLNITAWVSSLPVQGSRLVTPTPSLYNLDYHSEHCTTCNTHLQYRPNGPYTQPLYSFKATPWDFSTWLPTPQYVDRALDFYFFEDSYHEPPRPSRSFNFWFYLPSHHSTGVQIFSSKSSLSPQAHSLFTETAHWPPSTTFGPSNRATPHTSHLKSMIDSLIP